MFSYEFNDYESHKLPRLKGRASSYKSKGDPCTSSEVSVHQGSGKGVQVLSLRVTSLTSSQVSSPSRLRGRASSYESKGYKSYKLSSLSPPRLRVRASSYVLKVTYTTLHSG